MELAAGISLEYKKKPSFFFYLAPLAALCGKSSTFQSIEALPDISTHLLDARIEKDHLARFNRICAISPEDAVTPLYPITLVFVFFQRMLSLKQAPLSMFKVLGKRLQIFQKQALFPGRRYEIHCRIAEARIVGKGLELDLEARILAGDQIVWKAVETFFYRGNFGEITGAKTNPGPAPLSAPQEQVSWFLKEGRGFQFARISGDGNPLHYLKRYARLSGFERDFAQPFLVVGQALGKMGELPQGRSLSLDIVLKGQCYYNRKIRILAEADHPQRFDIFCEGNDRPCISAELTFDH